MHLRPRSAFGIWKDSLSRRGRDGTVPVVGESHRQDALAAIAGPKAFDGKQYFVGVTRRCDPTNEYDSNAMRVECQGQLVGFVSREHAAMISPAVQNLCGGVVEALGDELLS